MQIAVGQATATPTTFKVTGSLAIMAPGAEMAEPVMGTPTFRWADDSGEDQYLVEVFDAFGQRIWMNTMPGVSGGTPSMVYAGPALSPGMYYQWRVTSSKKGATTTPCELARSEDLRGVFYAQ